jgi:hypothetical protein
MAKGALAVTHVMWRMVVTAHRAAGLTGFNCVMSCPIVPPCKSVRR